MLTQCTEGYVVKANHHSPSGMRMAPAMHIGKRASGGAEPPPAITAFLYLPPQYGMEQRAKIMPTPIPTVWQQMYAVSLPASEAKQAN